MCHTPSKRRTDGRRDTSLRPSVYPFVRLSLFLLCLSGRPYMGERTAMLHRNIRGDKNPGSTNKYTKFGQLIIRKIIKIIVTRCHTLRLKMYQILCPACVRSSVSPWSLTLWPKFHLARLDTTRHVQLYRASRASRTCRA